MIDEKKIEEAAGNFIEYLPYYEKDGKDLYDESSVITAFKEGINWSLGNLWHDASEEPKENSTVLLVAKFDDEPYTAFYSYTFAAFGCEGLFQIKDVHHDDNNYLFQKDISKWAYFEDLMKGGK